MKRPLLVNLPSLKSCGHDSRLHDDLKTWFSHLHATMHCPYCCAQVVFTSAVHFPAYHVFPAESDDRKLFVFKHKFKLKSLKTSKNKVQQFKQKGDADMTSFLLATHRQEDSSRHWLKDSSASSGSSRISRISRTSDFQLQNWSMSTQNVRYLEVYLFP